MIWGDCPNVHEEQYLRVDDAAICLKFDTYLMLLMIISSIVC